MTETIPAMRKTAQALAFALGLLPLAALAQSAPATLPYHTVYGRLGAAPGDTGPGQAIPFSVLGAQLLGGAQTANTVYAGPAAAPSANPAFRALVGADLPNPSATTLGGVKSLTCGASTWFNALSTLGVLACVQPNFTNLAGSIAGSQIPTGTITTAMILDGTILNADIDPAAAIALTKLATIGAGTILGSSAGGTPAALNNAQAGAILCAVNRQVFLSGTNATYTTPTCNAALPTRIEWEFVGGGGGGAGSGTSPGAATAGGNTCVNTSSPACTTPLFVANGGALGLTNGSPVSGGTATGCDLGLTGGSGGAGSATTGVLGGMGGNSFFGGAGAPNTVGAAAGIAAAANSGSGGSGASSGTANAGGGGSASGYCRKLQTSPASSYFYTVGAAGVGGTLGTGGAAGGNGAAGLVIATAYWQ